MRVTVAAPRYANQGALALLALAVVLACAQDVMGAGAAAPVAEAVKAKDTAALAALVKQKSDVNVPQADGTTALHWAAYWDDAAAVDLLLRAGADVNKANRRRETPLSVASTNANVVVLERLLKAGANPNAVSGDGEPVLMTVARTGSGEAVKTLLAYGADPNAIESWHKQSALMWAAAADGAAATKALIEAGANIGAVADNGFTALHFAARTGALDASRVLVDAGADVNLRMRNGTSPLMMAIVNARWDVSGLLVENGADPNDMGVGFSPLHQLIWSTYPNVNLNNPGPEIRAKANTLDAYAIAKLLLDYGADPNARMTKNPPDGYRTSMDRSGGTPLHMAARVPDVELMRLFLSYGADPNLKTNNNASLLLIASGYGYQMGESPQSKPGARFAAIKLALELGGDVNTQSDTGWTPLHCAVILRDNKLIQFFVDLGADLYAETAEEDKRFPGRDRGKTPLRTAMSQMIGATLQYYPEQEAYLREIMGLPPIPPNRPELLR